MQIAFLLDLKKENEPTTHQKELKIKLEFWGPCFHEETQQGWEDGCTNEKMEMSPLSELRSCPQV